MDLDAHISSLLSSGASCVAAAQRNASNYKTATRAFPRVMPTANQWDYKNIIEKLQVGGRCGGAASGPASAGARAASCAPPVLSGLSTPLSGLSTSRRELASLSHPEGHPEQGLHSRVGAHQEGWDTSCLR